MTGIEQIAKERVEQRSKHGFSTMYDFEHNGAGQLLAAAQALLQTDRERFAHPSATLPDGWDFTLWYRMYLKSHNERLVIAAAFIAAELDRMAYKGFMRQTPQSGTLATPPAVSFTPNVIVRQTEGLTYKENGHINEPWIRKEPSGELILAHMSDGGLISIRIANRIVPCITDGFEIVGRIDYNTAVPEAPEPIKVKVGGLPAARSVSFDDWHAAVLDIAVKESETFAPPIYQDVFDDFLTIFQRKYKYGWTPRQAFDAFIAYIKLSRP